MFGRIITTTLLLAIAGTSSLGAQDAGPLHGTIVELGVGGGWAGTTCHGCIASNSNGASGFVHVGRSLTPDLVAGVEWARWSKMQFGERGQYDFVTATAKWYPIDGRGFFSKTGVGYGHTIYHQWDLSEAPYSTERAGLAYQVGFGYDVPLADHLFVAPFAQILATTAGTARVDGQQDNDGPHSSSLLQYGMSIGWR
jgi:hypothetical protein